MYIARWGLKVRMEKFAKWDVTLYYSIVTEKEGEHIWLQRNPKQINITLGKKCFSPWPFLSACTWQSELRQNHKPDSRRWPIALRPDGPEWQLPLPDWVSEGPLESTAVDCSSERTNFHGACLGGAVLISLTRPRGIGPIERRTWCSGYEHGRSSVPETWAQPF